MTKFKNWVIDLFATIAGNKKALAAVCSVAIVVAAAGVGCVAWNLSHRQQEVVEVDTEPTEVVADVEMEEIITNVIDIPTFTDCLISGESIKKDLTLTMKNTSGEVVSGVAYEVKLVPVSMKDQISDAVQAISDADAKIAAAQAAESAETAANEGDGANDTAANTTAGSSDTTNDAAGGANDTTANAASGADNTTNSTANGTADSAAEAPGAGDANDSSTFSTADASSVDSSSTDAQTTIEISSVTGQELTELEKLEVEKKQTIDAYKAVLDGIDADTYKDDDSDGMIHAEKLESGDYLACYIPTEGNDYSPEDYAVSVNVKDKIEYKVVENVKTVSAAAAGDTQTKNVPVETKPVDTVKYVASSTKVHPAEYGKTTTPTVKSSTSDTSSAKSDDGTVTLNMTKNASLYSDVQGANTTTINISYAQAAGSSSQGSSTDGNESVDSTEIPDSAQTIWPADKMQLKVTSSNDKVTVTDAGNGSWTITASGISNNTTAKITAVLQYSDTQSLTTECTVSVTGSSEKIKNSQGQQLYIGANQTEATYGTYSSSSEYYVMTKEETQTYYGWQTQNGYQYYYDENGNKVTGTQTINGATYKFGTDGALLTNGFGIDVSKWQGNIDWAQAKSAISFAIIRVGCRGTTGALAIDEKFAQNIKNAKANGVPVGVYLYSRAQSEAQAVEEASLAVQQVKKYGGVSLPIFIDMEDEASQGGLTTAQRDAIVMAFCNTVKNSGYSAGIYANKNWLTNYLTPSSYGGITIWAAQYNTTCTYKGHYDIWQYSSKGSIPGIKGNVDLDRSYF